MGFGDEGKGQTVDTLCRAFGAELVIRYSGGCQAGHNVHAIDTGSGKAVHHCFSQFGAGTLAGARTYLSEHVIIDPPAMQAEAEALRKLIGRNPYGLTSVSPYALVTTPYHKAVNRAKEIYRRQAGDNPHGSCAMGVGEARRYWLKYGDDAITAGDLVGSSYRLNAKLNLLQQRMLLRLNDLMSSKPTHWASMLEGTCSESVSAVAKLLRDTAPNVGDGYPPSVSNNGVVVFEGAQGALLDEYLGFHPNTTWSTVTPDNAYELANNMHFDKIHCLGVTRTYLTRHGAGPLPTETKTKVSFDDANPKNRWQGVMRFGWLDLVLLDYVRKYTVTQGLVVTCCDQVTDGWQVNANYEYGQLARQGANLRRQEELGVWLRMAAKPCYVGLSLQQLVARLGAEIAPVVMTGHGQTADKYELTEGFRSLTCF